MMLRFVGVAMLSIPPALAAAQTTTGGSPTGTAGQSHSMIRTPSPDANGGGSVVVPQQTDGRMNIPAPGVANLPYPRQSTIPTLNDAGGPARASGATTGN